MPSGTPSPLNYNIPKIDANNVLHYQDSIHIGNGTNDVAEQPIYNRGPTQQKQNGNSSFTNGRPSSAGISFFFLNLERIPNILCRWGASYARPHNRFGGRNRTFQKTKPQQ
jgi:hypothetical protein